MILEIKDVARLGRLASYNRKALNIANMVLMEIRAQSWWEFRYFSDRYGEDDKASTVRFLDLQFVQSLIGEDYAI